ncbi:MAG: ABC transporter ATP-binding protein [Polyangiaceae bacterium]
MATAWADRWLRGVDRLVTRGPAPIDLWAQFRRNRSLYLLGGFTLMIQQGLLAKRDFLVKGAVDAVTAFREADATNGAIMILIVSVVAACARLLSRMTVFTAGRNVEYELRARLIEHLHRLGPRFFARMPTGEIMSRATNDLSQVRLLLGFGVLNVFSSAFSLLSALYVMIAISLQLTLATLTIFPALMIVTRWFSYGLFKRNRENQQAIGKMSDRVLASFAGVRVVRSFAMEEEEHAAFEELNQDYLEKSLSLARFRGSMPAVMSAFVALGVLIAFWYGAHLLVDGQISTGDFVAFWLALLRLIWPMMAIGFVAAVVQRGRAGYQRLKEIFDAEPELTDGDRKPPETITGSLRVSDLSFAYGETVVLDGVGFDLPAGQSLAVVGRTGSGKSTLGALMARLLPPEPGTVFLDEVDVCELPLRSVRASVVYTQQNAFLFSTTVEENIAYALKDRGAEDGHRRVRQAAAEAQVDADVELLPEGYDTVVGERGVQLSGGQKQRVALARALISEPAVLVLDDPLSAVDARTESAILDAIERQSAERTVVLITHRIAAAQRCDRVIVLERGRVVESGTHEQLLQGDGLYALFAEEQQLERELAAVSVPPSGPSEARA